MASLGFLPSPSVSCTAIRWSRGATVVMAAESTPGIAFTRSSSGLEDEIVFVDTLVLVVGELRIEYEDVVGAKAQGDFPERKNRAQQQTTGDKQHQREGQLRYNQDALQAVLPAAGAGVRAVRPECLFHAGIGRYCGRKHAEENCAEKAKGKQREEHARIRMQREIGADVRGEAVLKELQRALRKCEAHHCACK